MHLTDQVILLKEGAVVSNGPFNIVQDNDPSFFNNILQDCDAFGIQQNTHDQ
jgi:hypothetical protein